MNKFESEKRFAERMKRCYPPSTRLVLLSMDDPYAPIPSGTKGTCIHRTADFEKIAALLQLARSAPITAGCSHFGHCVILL